MKASRTIIWSVKMICKKIWMLKWRLLHRWGYFGKNVYIGKNVVFQGDTRKLYINDNVEIKDNCTFYFSKAEKIVLDKNCAFERYNIINISGTLYVGKNSMTAPFVSIVDRKHNIIKRDPIRFSGSEHDDIFIDKDVWIATGVVILKGVKVGEGAVIGANSVVTKSVEPFTIVAGIPAKTVKRREE